MVGTIKTRPHQFLLMMGVFVFAVAGLVLVLLGRYLEDPDKRTLPMLAQAIGGVLGLLAVFSLVQGWWTAALIFVLSGAAVVFLVWGAQSTSTDDASARTSLSPGTVFALLLIVVGFALMVSVEFVFLRDTFNSRMNTVFKFYYQAWLLLGIGSAYGVFYVVDRLRRSSVLGRIGLMVWCGILLVLIGSGLSYTVAATASKAGGFQGSANLDGTRYIERYRPDDYAAVQWLRANAQPGATMVEAPGGSYSEYNRVSAQTGIPTLLGWGGHELQWRGNYDVPGSREPDIEAIYQSTSAAQVLALLDRYEIDYVYVGPLERAKYHLSPPMIAKFDRILKRVFTSNEVAIYGRSP